MGAAHTKQPLLLDKTKHQFKKGICTCTKGTIREQTDLRAQLVAKQAETDAAAREAAEAADEKIVALRAQLAAEKAKADAAHEAVGRQAAEAKEAAGLAAATAASIREAAALEDQIAAPHAVHAPAPPGGDPNSRVAESLARLGLPLARPRKAAGDVAVLNRDEVAALTHETKVSRVSWSRLARLPTTLAPHKSFAASLAHSSRC